jgi:hypothetical protein
MGGVPAAGSVAVTIHLETQGSYDCWGAMSAFLEGFVQGSDRYFPLPGEDRGISSSTARPGISSVLQHVLDV